MTDLTLNEYRNVSEGELKSILKEEAWKIYGCDSLKKGKGAIPSVEKFFSPLDIKSFLLKLGVKRY